MSTIIGGSTTCHCGAVLPVGAQHQCAARAASPLARLRAMRTSIAELARHHRSEAHRARETAQAHRMDGPDHARWTARAEYRRAFADDLITLLRAEVQHATGRERETLVRAIKALESP